MLGRYFIKDSYPSVNDVFFFFKFPNFAIKILNSKSREKKKKILFNYTKLRNNFKRLHNVKFKLVPTY